MIANWSNIANSVKSIQPILRPTVLLQDHTTDSQISRATTGMRKNSDQTNVSGRLICNLLARSNSRKQAVGLRNADNQTTVLNQTGRLRRGCGIEAFISTTQAQRPGPRRTRNETATRWPGSLERMVAAGAWLSNSANRRKPKRAISWRRL